MVGIFKWAVVSIGVFMVYVIILAASSSSFAEDNKWAVDYVTEENIHSF